MSFGNSFCFNLTGVLVCLFFISPHEIKAQKKSSYRLQYKQVDSTKLDITVYPSLDKKKKVPAIIFFYGGGWTKGTIDQFKPHAQYFAHRGMTGILVDYRVRSRNHTTPYDAVDDARDAIKFILEHSVKLGINPDNIVVSGGSAGGHLGLISTFLPKENASFKPAAMVLFNPIINTGPNGYGYERLGDAYKTIDPMEHVPANPPPAILFYGTNDKYVPRKQAEDFCHLLEAKGGICKTKFYKGEEHGFFNFGNKEYFIKTVQQADDFLVTQSILEDNADIKNWITNRN